MKLCGGENDERFEKIETSRDRCATAPKNFVGNKPGNEGAGGCDKRDRKSNQLKLRRLVIDVMHFLQEAREPLIKGLAHRASACIGTCHNPDHRIGHDDFEDIKDFDLHLSAGFLLRINRRKVRFLRLVFHDQRHAGADNKRDARWNPKQPPPMQRRNSDQPEKGKSGEQRRSEFKNAEAAEIDHETEDAGKASALGMTEPRRIYFHHSRRTEGLHVAIDSANQDKQPK